MNKTQEFRFDSYELVAEYAVNQPADSIVSTQLRSLEKELEMPDTDLPGLLLRAQELVDSACFALTAAEAEHAEVRAAYEGRFSKLQRSLQRLGHRTAAYRAEHVAPAEVELAKARASFTMVSEAKFRIEAEVARACQRSPCCGSWTCASMSTGKHSLV